jgi:hypothetical protein
MFCWAIPGDIELCGLRRDQQEAHEQHYQPDDDDEAEDEREPRCNVGEDRVEAEAGPAAVWESHRLVLFQFCLTGIDDNGADSARKRRGPTHPEQRGAPVAGALTGCPDGTDASEYGAQNGTAEEKFAQRETPVVGFNATARRWEVRKGLQR